MGSAEREAAAPDGNLSKREKHEAAIRASKSSLSLKGRECPPRWAPAEGLPSKPESRRCGREGLEDTVGTVVARRSRAPKRRSLCSTACCMRAGAVIERSGRNVLASLPNTMPVSLEGRTVLSAFRAPPAWSFRPPTEVRPAHLPIFAHCLEARNALSVRKPRPRSEGLPTGEG